MSTIAFASASYYAVERPILGLTYRRWGSCPAGVGYEAEQGPPVSVDTGVAG